MYIYTYVYIYIITYTWMNHNDHFYRESSTKWPHGNDDHSASKMIHSQGVGLTNINSSDSRELPSGTLT